MKKIINKIGRALQVILLAPVKLPGKAMDILKYLAIGVGIVESVIDDKEESEKDRIEEEGGPDESQ
ncbi:hypothetical protein D7322_16060 [Sphingobacterium puteale]|uniref:Uncharacterized protein n=1 Tax=Sphingobacterium puteale TaxID=2420510 RepID=A0A420VWQ4_9SPHI|nr:MULTISPECIES: hypothetical protein [Sphingobacterium]RKO70781.1 hypothetical protein D7322_16060 [Sphingobacterium puteale]